ncbi:MAG TPA: PIN domain-containing protein [Candidatus Saccharimonadales bacterium]|nr:PIN domain-containing protein [Candidatus Saccharimonadales bacterium]
MILLDANILLELALPARPDQAIVKNWVECVEEQFCISMLTTHLVLYFGDKEGITRTNLRAFLDRYPMQDLVAADYDWAIKAVRGRDYEDALQVAVAVRTGCAAIATLGQQFAHNYRDKIAFELVAG